jgi:23S rRNA pseudouridine1911/1915/1917 synthase
VAAAWRNGRVRKTYRALVSGMPREAAFSVDVAIGPVPHPRLGSVHAASATGKPALTHVRVLRAHEGQALVEAVIPTGRPHQIRIHLAAAGHPLVGDPLYAAGGLPRKDDPGLPGDPGYRLHAHRLELAHPMTSRPLVIECSPPEVLRDPASALAASG